MNDDDYDRHPVGFFGKLRGLKALTWLLIVGLLALTVGAASLVFLFP